MFCPYSSSYVYAPFQFLKRYGIKGPQPLPYFGNYMDISKLVCLLDTKAPGNWSEYIYLGISEVFWKSLQKLWTCVWVSSTLQNLVDLFAWQCSAAVQLTDNQQTNQNLQSPYIYHGWSRYYRGQHPYMMVADLEMVKQVTVKEFNSFMDREVSNLHHFVS